MADGFDIHLESEQAAHLRAAADVRGLDPIDYARQLLEKALDADDPWAVSRARLAEHDANGGASISLQDALKKLNQFRGKAG